MKQKTQMRELCLGVAAAAILWAPAAYAQQLSSQFDYRVVEQADDGTETLVERSSVKPGEVIHYTLTHENTTEDQFEGLVIVAPVPEGVTFAVGSEQSSAPAVFEIQAELEPEIPGLEWATLPAMRKVVAEDGTERMEPVPAAAIEAVRWTYETALMGGETAFNSYRVQVD